MAEALASVRSELGSDAVILHTRTYKRGGVLGFGARNVVEVTAGDGREIARQRKQAAERDRAKRLIDTANAIQRAPTPSGVVSAAMSTMNPSATTGDLIRRTYAAAKAEMERSQPVAMAAPPQPHPSPQAKAVQPTVIVAPAPLSGSAGGADQQLAAEMATVKRMVAQMMRQQKHRAAGHGRPDLPDQLVDQYLGLLQQEVAEELAEEVVQQVRGELNPNQIGDTKACKKAVASAVAALLPMEITAGTVQRAPDGRPRTIALVGPTGVGKTTTVAKLAATFKLKQSKKVGLITIDTYRIAAVDQLRTYAGIIGVPLHVVLSPEEMRDALARCADCDAILIDTAGRSQRDDGRLVELTRFIEAAQPHEVHLVLSSTCAQSVLMEAIERFAQVRTDSIIFTKLDEAVSFGVLLNVLRKVNKRLSYITTGQEVPHQIEPGNAARLAALVVGEGVI